MATGLPAWLVWLRRMALVGTVLLYLALALAQLDLPGLHYDEAREAGVNAMEMLRREDVQAFRSAGLQVGTTFLPLMVQDYIGATNVYLALPFLGLLGVTVPALRVLAVTCGLVTLLLVWRLGDDLASMEDTGLGLAGALAMLLLAVSPTFVFWSRQGVFVTNAVVTLALATVWMGLRWWRSGRPAYLYAMALLAGLGLWTKLLFVWVLVAMAVAAGVAWLATRRQVSGQGDGRSGPSDWAPAGGLLARQLGVAVIILLMALLPLVVFNLQTGGTLLSIFGNLGQSYYGVNNAAFLPNAGVRFGQLATLLRGDHLWYLGGPFANALAPFIAAGLVVTALAGAAWSGRRGALLTMGLAVLFVGLLILQSTFTVSDLFITHFAIVQPFLLVLVALAADSLWRSSAGRRMGLETGSNRTMARVAGWLVALALVAWLVADLTTSVRYHQALAQTGGHGSHSDAIYRLAQWLDERQVVQPLAMDWGLDAPLRYLTANRVQPLEQFGYDRLDAPDQGFGGRVAPLLDDLSRLYVFHMPDNTVFQGRREALEAAAVTRGLTLALQEAFYDRSGRPVFVVLRAE